MKRCHLFIACALCLFAAACGDTDIKETLGLNRHGPDEYQVFARPPLNVPPEFNLRVPAAGESDYIPSVPAQDRAHNAVLGTLPTIGATPPAAPSTINPLYANSPLTGPAPTAVPAVTASPLPTSADSQFLNDAGVAHADSNVRQEIQNDNLNGIAPKDSTYLLSTKSTADPMVDPAKEAQRIQQDKAQDKPVTTGDTPVIVPKDTGLLGNIF